MHARKNSRAQEVLTCIITFLTAKLALSLVIPEDLLFAAPIYLMKDIGQLTSTLMFLFEVTMVVVVLSVIDDNK